MGGGKEDSCLCFYVSLSGFSSFSGDPVRIALTLDIASISSISESNMVIVTQWRPTVGPLLASNGDVLSIKLLRNRMADARVLSPKWRPQKMFLQWVFWVSGRKQTQRLGREKIEKEVNVFTEKEKLRNRRENMVQRPGLNMVFQRKDDC